VRFGRRGAGVNARRRSSRTATPDGAVSAGSGRWLVVRQVGQFGLAGLIAVGLVGFATAIASRHVGEREAISDARSATLVKAQGLVEPVLTDGLLTGDAAAFARVDSAVKNGVLDRSLVRVKIWTPDGTIVYSDEPRLVGSNYQLGAGERSAIDTGVIEAEVGDLSKPENRFERDRGKLLEVYLPIRTPSGQRLLFEAYSSYAAVSSSGWRIFRAFAPISLGALVALELVQLPLAYSLAQRLRRRQQEREGLLRKALDASDSERRRIAADLHDGVVQNLAGVAYSIAAAAQHGGLAPREADALHRSAADVQESIRALRSLLVEIYPPNLAETGLDAALTDLLARVNSRGLVASLDTSLLREGLPAPTAGLLYRVAQEAVRNVLAHASATAVRIVAVADDTRASIEIVDDGIGFDPLTSPTGVGHVGLRGLNDLVADAGGQLVVESSPGAGMTVRAEVPIQ
jgi:two-component system NarL family sensor kinase